MVEYGLITICAVAISLAATPIARTIAIRVGAIDRPGGRRIHATPTPRFGGVAVYTAIISSLAITSWLDPYIRGVLIAHASRLEALGGASAFLMLVGLIDDRCSLRPSIKLLAEIAAAALVASAGYRIDTLFGVDIGLLSFPATVLWIVAVVNGINMVDGMDGLAAGLGLIASVSLFSIAMLGGKLTTAVILAALCGALLGFLWHNFHPARLFLGDSGSLVIGLLLAVTAVDSSAKTAAVAATLCPLLCLGLPLSELVLTTLRRTLRAVRIVRLDTQRQRYEFSVPGMPTIFTADREHIHHRLLAMGITYRKVVIGMYAVCAALGVGSVLIAAYHVTSIGVIVGAFVVVALAAKRLGYRELQPLGNGLLLPLFDCSLNRRITHVMCDLLFTVAACFGALWIVSDGDIGRSIPAQTWITLPLLVIAQMAGLALAGIYRRSYRHAGIEDMFAIGKAVVVAVGSGWLALVIAGHWEEPLPTFMVLNGYLLATLVVGSRLSFRCLEYFFKANQTGSERALIYGAGRGGVAALREMQLNPVLGMHPVGFLDDDPRKCSKIVDGMPVHSTDQLEEALNARKADVVTVASRKIPQDRLENIMRRCALAGVRVRLFPVELSSGSGGHVSAPRGETVARLPSLEPSRSRWLRQ